MPDQAHPCLLHRRQTVHKMGKPDPIQGTDIHQHTARTGHIVVQPDQGRQVAFPAGLDKGAVVQQGQVGLQGEITLPVAPKVSGFSGIHWSNKQQPLLINICR